VDITIGLRVEEEQEVTQHGEEGYVWDLPTYDPAGDYQSSVRII
jgi:hypothetical protein